ncbi:MAG: aminoacyl-tRNA hydrolase [Patescibacteria group bacterium]|nr:aminoacyl-tRNA hydrolase [Patescibacteria group bacterium]
MASSPRYVIVGLGNPGDEYASTYHNAGAMAVDFLAAESACAPLKSLTAKQFASAVCGQDALVKPLTFMNESGVAVQSALAHFKTTAGHLIVIHDDSDLPLGECKASFERGSAGHKGIESIIGVLGSNRFWRIRIGIRPPLPDGAPRKKAEEFVLRKIPSAQRETLRAAFALIPAMIAGLPAQTP